MSYAPWEDLGITEVDYWKRRYVEARQEVGLITDRLHKLEESILPPVEKSAVGRNPSDSPCAGERG